MSGATRDSFDVDKALNEVESAAGSRKASVQLTPASILKDVQRHALEVEDLLHTLDDVSSDRRAVADTLHPHRTIIAV